MNQTNRVDIQQTNLAEILFSIEHYGKPLILTKEGRGVLAIIPYIDPENVKVEPLDERVAINLLSIIKTNTKTGKREYAIIDLLLSTRKRTEELVGLDIQDVKISKTRPSTINIHKGKEDKSMIWLDCKPSLAMLIYLTWLFTPTLP